MCHCSLSLSDRDAISKYSSAAPYKGKSFYTTVKSKDVTPVSRMPTIEIFDFFCSTLPNDFLLRAKVMGVPLSRQSFRIESVRSFKPPSVVTFSMTGAITTCFNRFVCKSFITSLMPQTYRFFCFNFPGPLDAPFS